MKPLTGTVVWILLYLKVTGSQRDAGLVGSVLSNMQEIFTVPGIPDVTNQNQIFSRPISKSAKITTIASNPRQGDLFVLDAGLHRILRLSKFNIWMNQSLEMHFIKTAISTSQIAYDWINNNIYWTDGFYRWIGMTPAYGNDTSMFKIILHEDMYRPYGIALDPINGLLFWSDIGINVRIERATLTGEEREILIYKNVLWVTDLTIDSTTRTLFWVDGARHTVESCTYNGENRRVIRKFIGFDFTSLDYHKGNIFVSSLLKATMIQIMLPSGSVRVFGGHNYKRVYTLHMFDEERYPVKTDLCQSANCQHMCLNTDQGPRCLCKANYRLSSNGKTCTASNTNFERSVLASNGTHICSFDIQILTGFGHEYICISDLGNVGFIVPARDGMFFFERDTKVINFVTWDSNIRRTVSDAGDISVIVYSWVDQLIFWIDTASSTIQLKDLSYTTTSSTDIYSNLVQPSSLTMDQHDRFLFFINGNLGKKEIVKGNTVGDKLQTVYGSSKLANPTVLYYDLSSRRLFCIYDEKLASIGVDGGGKIAYTVFPSGSSFLIYKGFVLWIKGTDTFFSKNYNMTSQDITVTVPDIGKIEYIAVHDPFMMADKRGPCLALNGGCEHICLPGNNTTLCKCHHGFQLQSDNRTCDSNPLQSDFVIVSDFIHHKIYQIPLSGGTEIALDIPDVGNPSGVVYNNFTQSIIWFDSKSKRIRSSDLHGKDVTTFQFNGNMFAEQFAIDSSTGNLYYTLYSTQNNMSYIGVLKMTTFAYKTLISGLGLARYIVLYPSKGLMYWTDHGNFAFIGKATMDGVLVSNIRPRYIKWPNGITIDYSSDQLYWTDGYFDRIFRCDLNGGNIVEIGYDKDSHLMDIQAKGSYLYYTAWNKQKVMKMNKTSGEIVAWMTDSPDFGRLDSMDLFPGDPQPINTDCAVKNGQCSTFCLPNENGYSCACPDGINLKSDGRTCEGEIKCPQVFDRGNITIDCDGTVGAQCPYVCSDGYRQRPNVTSVTCLSNGRWDFNVDIICEEIKCTNESDRVNISTDCSAKNGANCTYSCVHNYKPRTDSLFLNCMKNGEWDQNIKKLCEAIAYSPKTENKMNTMTYMIGLSVATVGVITICIIFLFFRGRKRPSGYIDANVVFRSKLIDKVILDAHSPDSYSPQEVDPTQRIPSYVEFGDIYHEIDDLKMLRDDDKQKENEALGVYLTPCEINPASSDSITPPEIDPASRDYITPCEIDPASRDYITPSEIDPASRDYITPPEIDPASRDYITPCEIGSATDDYLTPFRIGSGVNI